MATEYPDDLRYTKDHEWARINGKSATIGITAFAIHSLGDITQVDLPGGQRSGLRAAVDILEGIDDIAVVELTSADVVRHRLVSEIVDAYEKASGAGELGGNRVQRRGMRK